MRFRVFDILFIPLDRLFPRTFLPIVAYALCLPPLLPPLPHILFQPTLRLRNAIFLALIPRFRLGSVAFLLIFTMFI